MRRVFDGVARGVLVVAVVASLAVPASARSREEQRVSPQPKRPDLVQMLRQFVVRALGDGLIIPRP
jgi:hypothetical protein